MPWFQIFQDGPEYEARRKRGTFTPPNLSLKEVRDAVPRHLHERSTLKSLGYVLRHLAFTCGFYYLATLINISTASSRYGDNITFLLRYFVRPSLWILYWGWQGITFAGIWCLGTFNRVIHRLTVTDFSDFKGHEVLLVLTLRYLNDLSNQAGHNALSSYKLINDCIGIVLHTFVL